MECGFCGGKCSGNIEVEEKDGDINICGCCLRDYTSTEREHKKMQQEYLKKIK